MSPKFPFFILLAISLVACNRHEEKVVTSSRPSRVAPPSANDIMDEKREEVAKDLVPIPPLGEGISFLTPDGENWVKYPSGLLIHELKRTSETEALYGQSVTVAYTLTVPGSTNPLEKYTTENPFTFHVGSKSVPKGLNMGIYHMRAGSRRRILVPPDLAFGKAGNPRANINPDETLIYEVDLLTVTGEPIAPPPPLELPTPIGPQPATPSTQPSTHPADRANP